MAFIDEFFEALRQDFEVDLIDLTATFPDGVTSTDELNCLVVGSTRFLFTSKFCMDEVIKRSERNGQHSMRASYIKALEKILKSLQEEGDAKTAPA